MTQIYSTQKSVVQAGEIASVVNAPLVIPSTTTLPVSSVWSRGSCYLGWFFYILSNIIPLIIFILVLNISFTSGSANCFVLYSQILDSLAFNDSVRIRMREIGRLRQTTKPHRVKTGEALVPRQGEPHSDAFCACHAHSRRVCGLRGCIRPSGEGRSRCRHVLSLGSRAVVHQPLRRRCALYRSSCSSV